MSNDILQELLKLWSDTPYIISSLRMALILYKQVENCNKLRNIDVSLVFLNFIKDKFPIPWCLVIDVCR